MKQNRLTAGGAAVVIAAGLSLVAVGAANAEPTSTSTSQKAERIGTAQQLHDSIGQAVAREQGKDQVRQYADGGTAGQLESVKSANSAAC